MNSRSLLLLRSAIALPAIVLSSCSPRDDYDTPPPYRPTHSGYGADSVYDTEAAYGDGAPSRPSLPQDPGGLDPGLPADPGAGPYIPSAPSISSPEPVIQSGQSTTVHTVVRGDTLSGISGQYGVSMESIRQANNMTGDVVVLGKKMIIPSR